MSNNLAQESWLEGNFRDCNGESNGSPLPGSVIRSVTKIPFKKEIEKMFNLFVRIQIIYAKLEQIESTILFCKETITIDLNV